MLLSSLCGSLTDLELPLNTALAALAVVDLTAIVVVHHLNKFARQRRVLLCGQSTKEPKNEKR